MATFISSDVLLHTTDAFENLRICKYLNPCVIYCKFTMMTKMANDNRQTQYGLAGTSSGSDCMRNLEHNWNIRSHTGVYPG